MCCYDSAASELASFPVECFRAPSPGGVVIEWRFDDVICQTRRKRISDEFMIECLEFEFDSCFEKKRLGKKRQKMQITQQWWHFLMQGDVQSGFWKDVFKYGMVFERLTGAWIGLVQLACEWPWRLIHRQCHLQEWRITRVDVRRASLRKRDSNEACAIRFTRMRKDSARIRACDVMRSDAPMRRKSLPSLSSKFQNFYCLL